MSKRTDPIPQFVTPLVATVIGAVLVGAWVLLRSWVRDDLLSGNADAYEDATLIFIPSVAAIAITIVVAIVIHRHYSTKLVAGLRDELRNQQSIVARQDGLIKEKDERIKEFSAVRGRINAERVLRAANETSGPDAGTDAPLFNPSSTPTD